MRALFREDSVLHFRKGRWENSKNQLRLCALVTSVALGVSGWNVRAQDSEWLPLEKTISGSVWNIRAADVKSEDADKNPKIWVKSDHSKDKTTQARTTMMYVELRCESSQFRMLELVSYNSNGVPIYSSSQGPVSMIVPETMMEAVSRQFCPD